MTTFESVKTLAYSLGPFVLPYLYSSFKKYQRYVQTHQAKRRPVPRRIGLVLNLLFIATIAAIVSSFYAFSYENLITKTNSRIQTPQNVLWERVASKRPGHNLTLLDEKLKDRLASTDGRCLYLMHGPDVTGNCPFCSSDEPRTFLYYALPAILSPHLFNMIVLGLATSSNVAGKEGNRFRTPVVLLGCLFAASEILIWLNFDWKTNASVTKGTDLFHFFGWARLGRGAGIAIIDSGLAWFLWATSTNRLMVISPPARERVDEVLKQLGTTSKRLTAMGIIRNATVRNEELHQKELDHWKIDEAKMQEVVSHKSVQKAMLKAKSQGRLDADKLERDAQAYVEAILPVAGS